MSATRWPWVSVCDSSHKERVIGAVQDQHDPRPLPWQLLDLQAGDVSGAALALFKSDAWPSSPVKSFASVSVLNQPGAKTFPIVAMWVADRVPGASWGMGECRAFLRSH